MEPSKSSPELLSGQSTPVPDLSPSPLPLQDSDSDDSEGESDVDEVSEPQFSVENVFTFSSWPHSAKRGQGQGYGDQGQGQGHGETCWTEEAAQATDTYGQQDTGGHRGARPDDDFLASESEEVCLCVSRLGLFQICWRMKSTHTHTQDPVPPDTVLST